MPQTITQEEFQKRYGVQPVAETLTSDEFNARYGKVQIDSTDKFQFGGGRPSGVGAGGSIDETLWEGAKRIAQSPLIGDPYKYFPENPPDTVIESLFKLPTTRHLKSLPLKAKKALYGGIAGIGRTAVGLTSPLNFVLLATLRKLPTPIARTASGGFAISMGSELPRIGKKLIEAAKEGDVERVSAGITEGLATAGMTVGAVVGAVRKPRIKPSKPITELREPVAEIKPETKPVKIVSALEGRPITPEELFKDTLLRRKVEFKSLHPKHQQAGVKKARQVMEKGRIDPEYQHSLTEMREGRRAAVPEKLPELPDIAPAIQRSISGKDGIKRPGPMLTVGDVKMTQGIKELKPARLEYAFDTPIRVLDAIGLKPLYRKMKTAELASYNYRKSYSLEHDIAKKNLSAKSLQRIGTALAAKRKSGLDIIKAAKRKVVHYDNLTSAEQSYYNWYRNKSDVLFQEINKARISAGKQPIPYVEDYFTFQRVLSEMDRVGFDIMTVDPAVIHKRMTVLPYEKMTTKNLREIEWDVSNVFNNYLRFASDHIHKGPVVAYGRELLKDQRNSAGKVVHSPQENAPRSWRYATDWLDYQAGQPGKWGKAPKWIERGLTKLNRNLAFAILSGSARSALIQPSAINATFAELGPKFTAKGINDLIHPSVEMKAVMARSDLPLRQYEIAVTEAMQGIGGKLTKLKKGTAKIGLQPLAILDMQTAKATWYGAYRYAVEFKGIGKGSQNAINYANDVVVRTQASAARSDLAPVQRSAAGRSMTMFQTFVINNWDFLRKDVLGVGNPAITNRMAFEKTSRYIIGAMLLNILYEEVLGMYSPFGDPLRAVKKGIDKGQSTPQIALEMAKELAEPIPVVGGSLRYGSTPMGAGIELIDDIVKDEPGLYWWEALGMIYGVPGTKQIAKLARKKKRKERNQ